MKKLVCVSAAGSGVRHRFGLLNHVKNFASYYGYEVHFLWGVTTGVACCRWEELFSPIADIRISNISQSEVERLDVARQANEAIHFCGERLDVVRDGRPLSDQMFAFNLPASNYLQSLVPNSACAKLRLLAVPNEAIRADVNTLVRDHRLAERIGIRVRVTEAMRDKRRPHRIKAELDECLAPIFRLPRETPVFIVTDSEYIQKALAAHFPSAVFLPKKFVLMQKGSRYVLRADKPAMLTFLKEAFCLSACLRVINIGGFLNDQTAQIWLPPYLDVAFR